MKLKKKIKKIIFAILIMIVLLIGVFFAICCYYFSPVSDTYEEKNIIIEEGSGLYDISLLLEKEEIIKNHKAFYYYLKLKKPNIYAAGYYLSPNMSAKEILDVLNEGGHNVNEISITFREGINMVKVAAIISAHTNNTYDDVINTQKDQEYLNSLIEKYWFISEEIKNDKIYYPLEGYLFPDTYRFSGPDVSVKEIFDSMINKMSVVLDTYKEKITNNQFTVHELLSIASVIELEGATEEERKGISRVFLNRLNNGDTLGSDVTTFYGVGLDMAERDLTLEELSNDNEYNTRANAKIPIGPIAMISSTSINAVINPSENNYYYFVSDKNRKVYFSITMSEHEETINRLKNEGLWYEW